MKYTTTPWRNQCFQKAVNSHDALVKALRAVQFGAKNGKCPVCAGWDMSSNGETPGAHTKDCIIGEALAKATDSDPADASLTSPADMGIPE